MDTPTDLNFTTGSRARQLAADYRRARLLEPRLADVERAADEARSEFATCCAGDDGLGPCGGCAWEVRLKVMVLPLIGFERNRPGDPWLKSMDCYDAVVAHVVGIVEGEAR